MIKIGLRRIALSIPLVLAATFSAWGARANVDRFDGAWSVVIITESGTCDRAYRYGLRIEGGRVSYAGESGVSVSGQVDAKGRVSVAVRSGDSMAQGSGLLSESSGGGSWQGRSQSSSCSGRWQAERGERSR
jgi:hypothetical protein